MKAIYITGGAMTQFGRYAGVLAPELAQQAIVRAMDDAGVQPCDIQAIYCANVLGGMILGQDETSSCTDSLCGCSASAGNTCNRPCRRFV